MENTGPVSVVIYKKLEYAVSIYCEFSGIQENINTLDMLIKDGFAMKTNKKIEGDQKNRDVIESPDYSLIKNRKYKLEFRLAKCS